MNSFFNSMTRFLVIAPQNCSMYPTLRTAAPREGSPPLSQLGSTQPFLFRASVLGRCPAALLFNVTLGEKRNPEAILPWGGKLQEEEGLEPTLRG